MDDDRVNIPFLGFRPKGRNDRLGQRLNLPRPGIPRKDLHGGATQRPGAIKGFFQSPRNRYMNPQ